MLDYFIIIIKDLTAHSKDSIFIDIPKNNDFLLHCRYFLLLLNYYFSFEKFIKDLNPLDLITNHF